MIPKKPRIYRIVCVPNGKVYVGSATYYNQRLSRHRLSLRRGNHFNKNLQASWNKHGEDNFLFEEIECVLRVEDLVLREQFWIEELRPEFNVIRTVYPTPLGRKQSEEERRRRGNSIRKFWSTHEKPPMSPETRAKISAAQLGKKRYFTDAHKLALSAASTGRRLSDETRSKIGKANSGKRRVFSEEHRAAIKAAWDKRRGESNATARKN